MHALGPDWMDPQYLLDTYGTAFFWISLAIVFVECGLFFPILPGDSLLFAIGIFIAGGELDIPLVVAIPALFVAAFAGKALADGDITGEVGDTFEAGELGEREVAEGGIVLVGPPTQFNAENIDDYDF